MAKVGAKFSRHIYTADYVTNSVVASDWISIRQIRRIGDLAILIFNGRFTGTLAASTEVTIAKINDNAYLPYNNSVFVNIPTQDNKGTILLSIKTTGEITIYSASTITLTGVSVFARAQVAYFCRGGVISYFIHLSGLPKSFLGRRWQDAGCEVYAGKNLRPSLCRRNHVCEKLDSNFLIGLRDYGNGSGHNTSRDVHCRDNHTYGVGRFWSRVFRSICESSFKWRNIHTVDTNIPVNTSQAVYIPVGQRYFLIHREGFNENYQDKIRTTSERRWAA